MSMEPPPLVVLNRSDVDTFAFCAAGKPTEGVTLGALGAGLTPPRKEAMLAHDVAHMLVGDSMLGSGTARFVLLSRILLVFMILTAVLSMVVRESLTWIALLVVYSSGVGTWAIRISSRLSTRHNDLLADSIAATITSDPGTIKTILEEYFEGATANKDNTQAALPLGMQVITFDTRQGLTRMYGGATGPGNPSPEVASELDVLESQSLPNPSVPGLGGGGRGIRISLGFGQAARERCQGRYDLDTIRKRIENLKAIEQGHGTVLETPLKREKLERAAPLAVVLILIAVINVIAVASF